MSTFIPKHIKKNIANGRMNSITLLLFWCALIVVSSVYLTTPLLQEFRTEFHIDSITAAWSSGVFSFFLCDWFFIFPPLSERYGRKEIILFGFLALAIATWLIGRMDEFLWIVVLRGVQGFVAASFAPTALAYVFEVYVKEKVATAVGFISFGYVTAGIVGQMIADMINQLMSWQAIFTIFGILYIISFITIIFVLPSTKQPKISLSLHHYVKQVKTIILRKNLVLCYVISFFLLLTFIGMYTVLGDYLGENPYRLSEKELFTVRTWGLVGMALSPFANFFIRRLGLIPTLRLSLAVMIIGMISINLVNELSLLTIMTVVYVAGLSLTFPSIMMVVGKMGGSERAVANAVYAFILFIGATLGPFIALWSMQLGGFTFAFSILALFLLIGWVISLCIKLN